MVNRQSSECSNPVNNQNKAAQAGKYMFECHVQKDASAMAVNM